MFARGAWMGSLNPAQKEAVTCGDGPVLVIAGAGTGKTWTLACRVAYLLERGVPPERLLLLTFSRRAAREMLARADSLLQLHVQGQGRAAGRVWGGTFHAVANRLLRQYGRGLGLRPDFTVLDQADMADLLDLVRGELRPAQRQRERRFPRKDTLAAIYSRMVNAGAGLSSVLDAAFPWCAEEIDGIRAIFAEYTRRKRLQNILDYDDLLLFWRALGETPAGAQVARQFDHVLVDEYQDTNPVQAQIIQALRRDNPNVLVVGDDAQAIYSFRAATVRNILDFPRHFPGARRITLEHNYRSTQPILQAANAVIALAPERFAKELWSIRSGGARPQLVTCADEHEQSVQVCEQVLEHREQGTPLRQQAVLFRSGHHSDLLELELARRNIPFVKYGGLKFLEAAHVKDALSLLRILENPHDEVSWFRVLQLLDGIGPAAARQIMHAIGVRPLAATVDDRYPAEPVDDQHLPEPPAARSAAADAAASPSPLVHLLEIDLRVAPAAEAPLRDLRNALRDCLPSDGRPLPPAAELARLRRFCEPIIQHTYANATARLHDLEQLEHVASGYASRGRFLSELALDPPSSTSDLAGPPLLDEDYLILSTVHSAKGGEWDVVHVIGAADGMFPSDLSTGDRESIEEERRLFYVALTRARDMLYVYWALRLYRRPTGLGDAHHFAQLTRFLPPPVQALFDRRATAGLVDEPRRPAAQSVERALAALWDA